MKIKITKQGIDLDGGIWSSTLVKIGEVTQLNWDLVHTNSFKYIEEGIKEGEYSLTNIDGSV